MNRFIPQLGSSLLACLLLIVWAVPLFAADAPKVVFRGLVAEGIVEGIFFTNAKGEPEEFKASDFIFSSFYTAPRGEELTFYKLIPATKEGEKPTREVVGSVKWPTGKGPFMVLASKDGERYDFSAAEDDESTFPIGSFRVINASRHEVNVRAGDKSAVLASGACTVLKPEEKNRVLFQVGMTSISDRLLFSNVWARTDITRTLIFIVNRPNPRHPIDLKRIQENDLMLKSQAAKEAQEAKGAQR